MYCARYVLAAPVTDATRSGSLPLACLTIGVLDGTDEASVRVYAARLSVLAAMLAPRLAHVLTGQQLPCTSVGDTTAAAAAAGYAAPRPLLTARGDTATSPPRKKQHAVRAFRPGERQQQQQAASHVLLSSPSGSLSSSPPSNADLARAIMELQAQQQVVSMMLLRAQLGGAPKPPQPRPQPQPAAAAVSGYSGIPVVVVPVPISPPTAVPPPAPPALSSDNDGGCIATLLRPTPRYAPQLPLHGYFGAQVQAWVQARMQCRAAAGATHPLQAPAPFKVAGGSDTPAVSLAGFDVTKDSALAAPATALSVSAQRLDQPASANAVAAVRTTAPSSKGAAMALLELSAQRA